MLTVGRCWRDAPLATLPHALVQTCTFLLYTALYAQPNHGLGKLTMHGSIMLGHVAPAEAMVCPPGKGFVYGRLDMQQQLHAEAVDCGGLLQLAV